MTSVTQEIHKEMEKGSRETKNYQKHTKKDSQNYKKLPQTDTATTDRTKELLRIDKNYDREMENNH